MTATVYVLSTGHELSHANGPEVYIRVHALNGQRRRRSSVIM